MKRIIYLLAATFIAVGTAVAGPFEDGWKAYNNGKYELTFMYWKESAKQGNVIAQSNLGIMYHQSIGVTQDFVEALKWFLKAAEQGNITAKYKLGSMYEQGAYSGVSGTSFQQHPAPDSGVSGTLWICCW